MLTNKAPKSSTAKYYRSTRSSTKPRSSCSTSKSSTHHPQHSHLQQLAQTHYTHQLSNLKRYIQGISKMNVLQTSLHNSPNCTPLVETSGRRHLALQSENNYYVEKINQLSKELVEKRRRIQEMEREVRKHQGERKHEKNQKLALRKMIELLNRENRVLKKGLGIPVGGREEKGERDEGKENKKTQV